MDEDEAFRDMRKQAKGRTDHGPMLHVESWDSENQALLSIIWRCRWIMVNTTDKQCLVA